MFRYIVKFCWAESRGPLGRTPLFPQLGAWHLRVHSAQLSERTPETPTETVLCTPPLRSSPKDLVVHLIAYVDQGILQHTKVSRRVPLPRKAAVDANGLTSMNLGFP